MAGLLLPLSRLDDSSSISKSESDLTVVGLSVTGLFVFMAEMTFTSPSLSSTLAAVTTARFGTGAAAFLLCFAALLGLNSSAESSSSLASDFRVLSVACFRLFGGRF